MTRVCKHCDQALALDNGVWVDRTGGDVCTANLQEPAGTEPPADGVHEPSALTKAQRDRLEALRDAMRQRFAENKDPLAPLKPWPDFADKTLPMFRYNPNHSRVEWGDYDHGTDRQPDTGEQIKFRASLANDHLRGTRLSDTLGYYTDREFQDETLKPIVARLSHGRALAGYTYGPGMSFSLDRTTVYQCDDDEAGDYATCRDAARAAHEYARIAAEAECEYQEMHREAERRAEHGVRCALMFLRQQWVIVNVEEIPRYEKSGWQVSERFGEDLTEYEVTVTRAYRVFATDGDAAVNMVSEAADADERFESQQTSIRLTHAGYSGKGK